MLLNINVSSRKTGLIVIIQAAIAVLFLTASLTAKGVREISQEELLSYIASNKPVTILDVRTVKEFNQGHIRNAINIPLSDLMFGMKRLGADKTRELIIYCRSGRRAAVAIKFLSRYHFTNIRGLRGHLNAWVRNGRPLVR